MIKEGKLYVNLCLIEEFKKDYHFSKPNEEEIRTVVMSKDILPLERLLRNIHQTFSDWGLQSTLINKVFTCQDREVAYFVPELVYMAIRKNCKPMKKLLIARASRSESLRRLILWNVKAFTVLMKQQDPTVKENIDQLQKKLIQTVPNQSKFMASQKAIAMITQASLTLKTYKGSSDDDLKLKLNSFIKRFNSEHLNNLQHCIQIPFRVEGQFAVESTMVVHIVEDDCSVFPTRKRVPYRIIIETVNIEELNSTVINESKLMTRCVLEKEKDLYASVLQVVEGMFNNSQHILNDVIYPFVVDNEEVRRISQMKTYFHQKVASVQNEGGSKKKIRMKTMTQSNVESPVSALKKFRITENESVRKFDAIFIPDVPSKERQSEFSQIKPNHRILPTRSLNYSKQRLSIKEINTEVQTKVFVEETTEMNFLCQEIWGKSWHQKEKKLKTSSLFGKLKSHRLRNVVVKGGDDLRQQIICMQLIYKMRDILVDAHVDALIKPYEIIVLSQNSGILEFVSNSITIHAMREKSNYSSISEFFQEFFQTELRIKQAKNNFLRSLAGSSLLTFILELKDRHNKNILLDIDGNIIHIDFGFILGMCPGNINFESSPFKLTKQYVELMGGKEGQDYLLFCDLFCAGMMAIRKRVHELTIILQIMMNESDLDCFKDFHISSFTKIFQLNKTQAEFKVYCMEVIERSCMNSRTAHYDTFQQITNKIHP